MFRLILATLFVACFLAASAAACPPVQIGVSSVQVQAGCFAPSVAVQAYAVPQAVVVQAHPVVAVQAVRVKAAAVHPQRRFFGRVFGPRVSVRVRGF